MPTSASDRRDEQASSVTFRLADPRSEEAIASMMSYFDELEQRFPEGFDPGDTLVADAASFDEPHGTFLVAWAHGHAVGCGGVHLLGGDTGEIKRMWIDPEWRGIGLGKALLSALEEHGARLGFTTIRLDTNSVLTTAIRMYETAGYKTIPRYNDNPFAKHWFEKVI